MPRIVTAPTLAQAAAGASQPLYYLQIDWSGASSRLCSHSTRTWAGQTWQAGAFTISFTRDGRPGSITLLDPDAVYRTLALAGGISDRRVRLWHGYVDADASDDPLLLADGYADGCDIANGKLTFSVESTTSAAQFSPRKRIGPLIGVNHCGQIGDTVRWNNTIITLDPRRA